MNGLSSDRFGSTSDISFFGLNILYRADCSFLQDIVIDPYLSNKPSFKKSSNCLSAASLHNRPITLARMVVQNAAISPLHTHGFPTFRNSEDRPKSSNFFRPQDFSVHIKKLFGSKSKMETIVEEPESVFLQ